MSWRYSAWAKEQRVGSPHGKAVLLCIGDGANAHTGELFDSQASIAEAAEVDERTAREWICRFERWKLIRRERRKRADGYRDTDKIICNPDVFISNGKELLQAEREGMPEQTLPEAASGNFSDSYRKPMLTLPEAHADLTGSPRRCIEPNSNQDITESERERASADDVDLEKGEEAGEQAGQDFGEALRGTGKAAFKAAHAAWPSFTTDSTPEAEKAWFQLLPAERLKGAEEAGRYVAAAAASGRKVVCSFGVYLREKRWEKLAAPDAPAARLTEPPFGPAWCAERMARLKGFVAPGLMLTAFEKAAVTQGILDRKALEHDKALSARAAMLSLMDGKAGHGEGAACAEASILAGRSYAKVERGSDLWRAWQAAFVQEGWPWLPDMGGHWGAYFPAEGPDGFFKNGRDGA